jgi:hypothetical protein
MDCAGRDLHPGTLTVSRQHPTGSGMQPCAGGAICGSILSNNVVGAWNITGTATFLSFKNNQVTGPTGSTPAAASFQ